MKNKLILSNESFLKEIANNLFFYFFMFYISKCQTFGLFTNR